MFDQWTWPERGVSLMLTAGDFCARRVIDAPGCWAGGGGVAPCPVGQSQPLPVGGGVNNVATGKINCRQAAGLRGALWRGEGRLLGKASDLSSPEEISQGRPKLTLKMLL